MGLTLTLGSVGQRIVYEPVMDEGQGTPRVDTVRRLRAARGYSQEAFAQEAGLNRAYMGGVERGQRNVGVVNLHRIAEALGMSLSDFFAEVEGEKERDDG